MAEESDIEGGVEGRLGAAATGRVEEVERERERGCHSNLIIGGHS